jgi:predicted ribosomally synthesized peptide with SipW-like signal peptide
MISKKYFMFGALGLCGLGLIGAGAGATFTQSVSSSQKVTAGTMNVTLTGPAGSVVSGEGHIITLAATAPESSTFDTKAQKIVMTNNGTIPVSAFTLQLTDDVTGASSAADQALQSQLDVRVISDGYVIYDGTVSGLEALKQVAVNGPIPVGGTDEIETEFYAGAVPAAVDAANNAVTCAQIPGTACLNTSSLSLNNYAEGGSVTPTLTLQYEG